jgi:hypothetical protein
MCWLMYFQKLGNLPVPPELIFKYDYIMFYLLLVKLNANWR